MIGLMALSCPSLAWGIAKGTGVFVEGDRFDVATPSPEWTCVVGCFRRESDERILHLVGHPGLEPSRYHPAMWPVSRKIPVFVGLTNGCLFLKGLGALGLTAWGQGAIPKS